MSLELLHFIVLDHRFLVELDQVKRVIPLIAVDPIPNAPNFVAGMANIEGVIIPIIDLALRMGQKPTASYTLQHEIMICQHDSFCAGLIVDDV